MPPALVVQRDSAIGLPLSGSAASAAAQGALVASNGVAPPPLAEDSGGAAPRTPSASLVSQAPQSPLATGSQRDAAITPKPIMVDSGQQTTPDKMVMVEKRPRKQRVVGEHLRPPQQHKFNLVEVDIDRFHHSSASRQRPRRHHIAPLCAWKNEKVLYKRTPGSATPTISAVVLAQPVLPDGKILEPGIPSMIPVPLPDGSSKGSPSSGSVVSPLTDEEPREEELDGTPVRKYRRSRGGRGVRDRSRSSRVEQLADPHRGSSRPRQAAPEVVPRQHLGRSKAVEPAAELRHSRSRSRAKAPQLEQRHSDSRPKAAEPRAEPRQSRSRSRAEEPRQEPLRSHGRSKAAEPPQERQRGRSSSRPAEQPAAAAAKQPRRGTSIGTKEGAKPPMVRAPVNVHLPPEAGFTMMNMAPGSKHPLALRVNIDIGYWLVADIHIPPLSWNEPDLLGAGGAKNTLLFSVLDAPSGASLVVRNNDQDVNLYQGDNLVVRSGTTYSLRNDSATTAVRAKMVLYTIAPAQPAIASKEAAAAPAPRASRPSSQSAEEVPAVPSARRRGRRVVRST